MTCRAYCIQIAVLVGVLAQTTGVSAQGRQSDYARANGLHALTHHKVYKMRIEPHWLAGGTRFWYSRDLAGNMKKFVLVDAVKGSREPAFDHARLAAALGKAMGKPLDAQRLPIEGLNFSQNEPYVVVRCEGKFWKCDLRNYELQEEKGPSKPAPSVPPLDAPRATKSTGPETSLTFVNRTKAAANILWIDPEGKQKPYGTIRAGDQLRQHTYAGHVWLATDPKGKALAVFEAGEEPADAVIEEKAPQDAPRPEKRRPGNGDAVSPDRKWRAFFKDHNLYVCELGSEKEFALSTDGSADDEYAGTVCWSPDSQKLAALRTKKGDDRKVCYVESSPKDQLQPKLHSYDYLKPGDRIPQARPQLFDVAARRHVAVSDELFPNPWSVTELRWSPDSREFTFLYNQRGHQVLRVIAVDTVTGEARAVIDERSPTFIDYAGKHFYHRLDDTKEIVWMSEREGWNHLYLYDAESGRVKNQITKGPWVIRDVDEVDQQKRQIWFRAGGIRPGQDPYYVHYGRVNFDGTGLVILTEGDGAHTIEYSPDHRFFIDTWSRVDLPPQSELRAVADGRLVCELEKADWSGLLKTGWQIPERFVAKGRDGATDIFGVIFRPTSLDPGKKYPVIEEIYAGPQDSYVPKSFSPFYKSQAMAELGFIVVNIDGMGTSNRSKAFHDVCWKNLADAGLPDRIAWMKAAASKYPYIDIARVGVYGGSAGGQSAVGALLTHGDFYKVAAADCGCHDNRMDKIWWNELWMGWPVGPHYAEQSNVTQAHRLQGKLLLIVGEMDENVDPASTMQVVNALIKADKDFDFLVVPGQGHGAAETAYGNRRRQDFFVRHLLGVEPRGQ